MEYKNIIEVNIRLLKAGKGIGMKRKLGVFLAGALSCMLLWGCGKLGVENAPTDVAEENGSAEGTVTEEGQKMEEDVVEESGEAAGTMDWPTITLGICPLQQVTDLPLVNDALNGYLESIDAGVYADIICLEAGNLSTTLTLMLSSTEQPIDLFTNLFYGSLSDVISNDQCIPLDEYLGKYPEVAEIIGEKFLPFGQLNGVQYGLPIVNAYASLNTYALRRDIAEAIGVSDMDGQQINFDELTEMLIKAKEAFPELCFFTDAGVSLGIGIDTLGDGSYEGVLLNRGQDTTEVVNYFETEEFRRYLDYTEKWANAGLFIDDPLNNSNTIAGMLNNGLAGGEFFGAYSVEAARTGMSTYGDYVIFPINDAIANASSGGSSYFISSVCQNPDAAMKMLALLYTDPVVATYVAQGIEGVHYVVDENGCSWYPEGKDLTNINWCAGTFFYFPNGTLTYPFETADAGYYRGMIESNKSCTVTDALGFVFDNSNVYDEYSAVGNVVTEYLQAIIYHQTDVGEYLPKFQEELKKAGIDVVIAEKQSQLDAFLADK